MSSRVPVVDIVARVDAVALKDRAWVLTRVEKRVIDDAIDQARRDGGYWGGHASVNRLAMDRGRIETQYRAAGVPLREGLIDASAHYIHDLT